MFFFVFVISKSQNKMFEIINTNNNFTELFGRLYTCVGMWHLCIGSFSSDVLCFHDKTCFPELYKWNPTFMFQSKNSLHKKLVNSWNKYIITLSLMHNFLCMNFSLMIIIGHVLCSKCADDAIYIKILTNYMNVQWFIFYVNFICHWTDLFRIQHYVDERKTCTLQLQGSKLDKHLC